MRLNLKKFSKVFPLLLAGKACLFLWSSASANAETKPEEPTKLVTNAYELFESGETDLALQVFNEALEYNAADLPARLGQAMIFQEQLRYEDAFSSYDMIVKHHPTHAFAWNGRGLAAFNLENFDEALNSFQQATADQPINGFFYESLAWTHLCLGDYKEATNTAKKATLIYHQNGETAAYPLLIAYFSQIHEGNIDDAIQTLAYAQRNQTNTAWPTPIFGYLAGQISAPDLISFVTDTAQETEAHTYIGMYLRFKGQSDAAKTHLNWVTKHGDQRVFEYTLARSLQARDKVAVLAP